MWGTLLEKRRTRPAYLSEEEYERERERVNQLVEGITGTDISEKNTSPVLHTRSTETKDIRPRPPKASFRIRLNETDNLQLAIWSGRKDPDAEVIVATIQSKQGDDWKNIGKIAVYRSSDGEFSQLPERKRN